MLVVVHGRGVIQTGSSVRITKILAYGAKSIGRDAFYFGRYTDSPERVQVPQTSYAVIGELKLESLPPEEIGVIGEIFDCVAILDSALLIGGTSQRISALDGLKQDGALIVNTSLGLEGITKLIKKFAPHIKWKGKAVLVPSSRYYPDVAIACSAAICKATEVLTKDKLGEALSAVGIPDEVKEKGLKAYDEIKVKKMEV